MPVNLLTCFGIELLLGHMIYFCKSRTTPCSTVALSWDNSVATGTLLSEGVGADTKTLTTSMVFMHWSRSGHSWVRPAASPGSGYILAPYIQQLSVILLCTYYGCHSGQQA